VSAIADTGFLVAFGNRRDSHHEWAYGLARRVVEPLLTCEAVLAETVLHLGDASLVVDFSSHRISKTCFQFRRPRCSNRRISDKASGQPTGSGGFVSDPHERIASEVCADHDECSRFLKCSGATGAKRYHSSILLPWREAGSACTVGNNPIRNPLPFRFFE
jgi:hypothetical protein